MVKNLGGYFVGQMKRRAVEVSEKHMTEADRAAFREAKAKEVRNFIAAQPLRPSRQR